jgi:hypothetical protein
MPIVIRQLEVRTTAARELTLENVDARLRNLERFISVDGDSVIIRAQSVEIHANGVIALDSGREVWISGREGVFVEAGPSRIQVSPSGVTVNAAASFSVASSTASISSATLTVDSGMSRFSGVVRADTMITNTIIASTYTPGAGNLW